MVTITHHPEASDIFGVYIANCTCGLYKSTDTFEEARNWKAEHICQ